MKILAIECATEHRSVALLDGDRVRERGAAQRTATGEPLLGWAQELLDEAGLTLPMLDLIAFSQGPGSFTGVRLGASLAQGLGYSGNLPVAGVSTLRGLARGALERSGAATTVLVCQDARMDEVYWARFARAEGRLQMVGTEHLSSAAGVDLTVTAAREVATGSAFPVQVSLLQRWRATAGAGELLECTPRAQDIARVAALDGLSRGGAAERALPVYLRHNVATPSSEAG